MSKTIEDEIIESINEWPVTDDSLGYTDDPTQKIHNPNSVSSFFLRNVGKPKPENQVKPARGQANDEIEEVLVDVALARWWRKTGKAEVGADTDIPTSDCPHTVINYVASTKAGTGFLRDEIRRLRDKIASGVGHHTVHSALASFYEKIANLSLAKMHLETAIDKAPEDKEYKWRMHRLKLAFKIRQEQEKVLVQLNICSTSELTLPLPKQVRRVSADHLSYKDFLYKYALTGTPVIITGLVSKMTTVPWTLEHISQMAGDCSVTLKKHVKESVKWAKLEDGSSMKVKDFIDSLHSNTTTDKLYLFDWNIPVHCPQLAEELVIPKYFAGDFLQRTTPGSHYQDSWPSLFIAPGGVASDLHVDAFGSNFWMALFEGRKRWVFYSEKDTLLLYPTYSHPWSTDPIFQVDLGQPDTTNFPLLSEASPLECILEPGELLFVPAGCPHRVENLETSLAISGNYVDLSNIDRVKQELAVTALIHQSSEELVKQLSDPDFKSNMCADNDHMKWKDFKSWSTQDYQKYDITPEIVQNKIMEINASKEQLTKI